MTQPTELQIRGATLRKIQRACDAIQEAQNQLGTACGELSALMYGAPAWKKAHKLYDNIHAFWYVVDGLRHHSRVRIDSTTIDALRRALEQQAARGQLFERQVPEDQPIEGGGGDAVLDRGVS